jgi:pilus assembly protein TadC
MKSAQSVVAILIAGSASAWGASSFSQTISNEAMTGLARGEIAIFTLLIGFCSFMLKEIQSIEAKKSLSEIALDRLRHVQSIVSRRLLWMIACGFIGTFFASLCSFSTGEISELLRTTLLPMSFTLLIILAGTTIGYLPFLYFDLKKTREILADMITADEARKELISTLQTSSQANKTE